MLERAPYPTPEELDIIMARARRMRARYLSALFARAVRNVAELFSAAGPRRRSAAPRLRMDAG